MDLVSDDIRRNPYPVYDHLRSASPVLHERVKGFRLASEEPWEPRKALHVHGPTQPPIRFEPGRRAAVPA
jgi:hypothetical protein